MLSDGFTHVIINKMENKLENKEKFFALYFKQDLLRINKYPSVKIQINSDTIFDKVYNQDSYLLLKSIDDITPEDISSIFKTEGEKEIDTIVNFLMGNLKDYNTFTLSHWIDDIRAKGYAWPWMGLSVERLIDYGWVRL